MYIIILSPVIFVSNSGKLDSQLKFVVHVHCVDILQHYVNCPCFYTPHCSVCVSEFNINFEYYMALYIISQMLLHCPIQLSKHIWRVLDWKQVPLDTDSVASSWHDTLGRSVGCVLVWLWNPSSKACVLACPPFSLTSDLHRSTSLLRLWCRQSLLLQFHSDRRITTVQLYTSNTCTMQDLLHKLTLYYWNIRTETHTTLASQLLPPYKQVLARN